MRVDSWRPECVGDPRVLIEVVFSEPPSFSLLHVYEHAEAAAVPGDCVQQPWRISRGKDLAAIVSVPDLNCGM